MRIHARKNITTVAAVLMTGCSIVADYPYMKEGQPHAEALVGSVVADWDATELINMADPRMLAVLPETKITDMFSVCSRSLGHISKQELIAGATGIETAIAGKVATYRFGVQGDKAAARIVVKLQKVAGQWRVLGFWVELQR